MEDVFVEVTIWSVKQHKNVKSVQISILILLTMALELVDVPMVITKIPNKSVLLVFQKTSIQLEMEKEDVDVLIIELIATL